MKYAGPRFFVPQKSTFVKWLKEHINVMDISWGGKNPGFALSIYSESGVAGSRDAPGEYDRGMNI
jgi:hypothetical protein